MKALAGLSWACTRTASPIKCRDPQVQQQTFIVGVTIVFFSQVPNKGIVMDSGTGRSSLLGMYARRGPSKCRGPQVQYEVFPVFTSSFLLSFFSQSHYGLSSCARGAARRRA